MDDAEFQKLLNAEPPVVIEFGIWQTLILNGDGFIVKNLWGEKRYQWKHVSIFKARGSLNARSDKGVYFNIYNNVRASNVIRRLFSGYHCHMWTLIEGYKSFYQLADILNHWRERALANNSK